MDDWFEIYRFIYVDKETGMKFEIYARKEETADRIANLDSELHGVFQWRRRRFFFKKKIMINVPPYELELEQEDYVLHTKEIWEEYSRLRRKQREEKNIE